MLSCESYARILNLKPSETAVGPWLVFVGVNVLEETATKLHKLYKSKSLICTPKDLVTTNTAFSSHFVFRWGSFQSQDTLENLWRVASEGARVVILDGVREGGVVEKPPAVVNPQEYGLMSLMGGVHSDWPYQVGIIRRDLAKHFRR